MCVCVCFPSSCSSPFPFVCFLFFVVFLFLSHWELLRRCAACVTRRTQNERKKRNNKSTTIRQKETKERENGTHTGGTGGEGQRDWKNDDSEAQKCLNLYSLLRSVSRHESRPLQCLHRASCSLRSPYICFSFLFSLIVFLSSFFLLVCICVSFSSHLCVECGMRPYGCSAMLWYGRASAYISDVSNTNNKREQYWPPDGCDGRMCHHACVVLVCRSCGASAAHR